MPEHCVAEAAKDVERKVASQSKAKPITMAQANVEVATVQKFRGSAWVKSALNKKSTIQKDMKIYETDTIITGSKSAVVLIFNDLNRVFIHADTEVQITEYTQAKEKKRRRALLDLKKGKLRSSVKQKYENSQQSFYRVRSKSAVAGVRGTDFVVEISSGTKQETKISTLSGEVGLSGRFEDAKVVSVPNGHRASFVVNTADNSMFDDSEKREFAAKGYLTPVYKMSDHQVKEITYEMSIARFDAPEKKPKKEVKPKMVSSDVCQSPSAQLNQCLWTCSGNPKGQNECRIDLPSVSCVRKRCNANGEWKEETRIPASESFQCPAEGYTVKACDY
tara:strand:+ start:24571 stop:25572 length:1002 start_codon:yes stop_codon:yes gene_type:complete